MVTLRHAAELHAAYVTAGDQEWVPGKGDRSVRTSFLDEVLQSAANCIKRLTVWREIRLKHHCNAGRADPDKFAGIQFVFIDRDGILNRKLPESRFVVRCQDLELIAGAADAVAKLNEDGRKVIVVTNQRSIARGALSEEELARLHDFLRTELAEYGAHLDAIYYCPHDPDQQACRCRKPGPGLFEQAFRDFPGASAETSLMIGDSLSDIQAGYGLGIPTIFVEGDPRTRKPGREQAVALADAVADSLKDAVESLMPISVHNTRWFLE